MTILSGPFIKKRMGSGERVEAFDETTTKNAVSHSSQETTEEQEAAENAVKHSQEDERTYRSSGERFEAFSRGLYDVSKQRRTF